MSKYNIINHIRDEKKNIEARISDISEHTKFMVTVEIMTQTWIIKSNIDFLEKMLKSDYVDNAISYNQYRLAYTYIKTYEDNIWSRLYDLAQANDIKTAAKGGEN